MKGFAAAILAAGLALSAPAAADGPKTTTQEWLRICDRMDLQRDPTPMDFAEAGKCLGFIVSFIQGTWFWSDLGFGTACLPDGVSVNQMHLLWKKYMEQHPEHLHIPAYYTLYGTAAAAFPCPDT